MHPAMLPEDELAAQCRLTFSRRSGPGGQHRHKVETAVVARHEPTGIEGQASERRSQSANRDLALFRLRVNLALGVRGASKLADEPSIAWRAHCRGGRVSLNPNHERFPAILAEALDILQITQGDPRPAAQHFGCTPSQLVRLLTLEPRAFTWLNDLRRQTGERPLHAPR